MRRRDSSLSLSLRLSNRLLAINSTQVLQSEHSLGSFSPEALPIEMINKHRQRRLPSLLTVIVKAAEFLWVHAELTSHLNMSMAQPVLLPCVKPWLQLLFDIAHKWVNV